jgi:hypothetical protein
MTKGTLHRLSAVQLVRGKCFAVALPTATAKGDDLSNGLRSSLRLFEDGREIGPAHARHDHIAESGAGRFSHWGMDLYFSSSDGTDPRDNGREYIALVSNEPLRPYEELLAAAAAIDPEALNAEQRYAWGESLFNSLVPEVKLSEFARSFFNDREFLQDYERFDNTNFRSLDRKFAMVEFAKLASMQPGQFAECGVFKGASAFLLAKTLESRRSTARLHLFDSFSGLSEPDTRDGAYWKAGVLSCSLQEVQRNLIDFAHRVDFHPGWIPTRFQEVADDSFVFVHIDVDLYQPTSDSLEFFGPRMVSGGLIVCDDYGFDTCPGARLALDEYVIRHALPLLHLPTGQGVIIFRHAI